jgi:hypothetical protein
MSDDRSDETPLFADGELKRIKADLIAEAPDEPSSMYGRAGFPYIRRVDDDHYGLVSDVAHETEKAWLVERPSVEKLWLPKSRCRDLGEDGCRRAILIVPAWLLEDVLPARFLPAVAVKGDDPKPLSKRELYGAVLALRHQLKAERDARDELQGKYNSVWASRAGLIGSNNQLRRKLAARDAPGAGVAAAQIVVPQAERRNAHERQAE